jgi:hypothetical protein
MQLTLEEWLAKNSYFSLADALEDYSEDDICPALCSKDCQVEPDGHCPHGAPSLLLAGRSCLTRGMDMNAFQRDYIEAKALRDTLYERKHEILKEHDHLLGSRAKENINKYVEIEMQVDAQLGIESARRHFLEAQVNLFGWARRELERLDWKGEGYHDVLALFERRLLPSQQEKLADICLRLNSPR